MILVMASGCFDILHPGHHRYLEQARSWGDRLIVAVNSDANIRSYKPPPRPIQNEADRVYQVRNLRFVDEAFICYEPTAAPYIIRLRPQIFARGIDYKQSGGDSREVAACKEAGCELRFTDTPKYASGDYVKWLC